jgi:PPP family 3-phenylpropionic acid transporter
MPTFLALFYFFYFGIIGIYIIFLPKVLSLIEYSSSDIGIILSAAPLIRFLLPFAFVKGFKHNRKSFNVALVIMIFSSISFYFSLHSFYPLVFSNIGLGIGMSLTLPYIEVIALTILKKERYGKIRLFGSVGFILVALVLVRYLSSAEVAIYYLISFVFATAIFAFILAKIDATTKKKHIDTTHNTISLLRDWKLWFSLMLIQVSFGAFYNFFTIYETNYGISLDMTINLWVFGVIVEIIMLFFQGKLFHYNLITLLQITIFSAVIRWFLVFLFPQNIVLLFVAQSLHALSFALFYSVAISYLHQIYTNKVLAQQFFSGITFGFGGLVGAFSFGYLYEWYPSYIFLVASAIALVSFYLITLWKIDTLKMSR